MSAPLCAHCQRPAMGVTLAHGASVWHLACAWVALPPESAERGA